MKSNPNKSENEPARVELKYCEHCGGLWLRESGTGGVYCASCRPKVADLPIPKKKPGKVTLPVRPRTVVEDFEFEIDDDEDRNFEAAAGGAA